MKIGGIFCILGELLVLGVRNYRCSKYSSSTMIYDTCTCSKRINYLVLLSSSIETNSR